MDFEHPPSDPVEQLRAWLDDARQLELPNPESMVVATIDPDGRPSARVVLLRGIDDTGVTFYTNYESRKGRAIDANPEVTMVLHWDLLHRQIVIEGRAARAGEDDSDAYWARRPRGSQIGAWASRQSEPVGSRDELETAYAEAEARFEGGDVPRPPHWGGYRVEIRSIVFWQARAFRLHDRMRYTRDGRDWTIERLYP
ncbi:MAG: pyridoxamine 5'-phosphate oxidase [Planctomycetota bacterium]|jgi:pyridoxamine 5'-phosphate oxidase